MEEMFDVFDKYGNHLGVKPKSFCHSENPGVFHKPVWIWIFNSNGQILIQKRASTKKFMPNKWDGSATGHVCAGETALEGCVREVYEELGLTFKESDFIFLGEFPAPEVWELGQVYCIKTDKTIKEMKLQESEVSEVMWLELNEFEALLMSDEFLPYSNEYKTWVVKHLKSKVAKL